MKPNSEYAQYVLQNTNNYKPIIQNTTHEILSKFTQVILEYMFLISEKINIKNKRYYVFIFERGIETIIHIFSMIFYYTKNLDLTFYHSQKAYYFYIEFIEQISDDNITFLQLSSRDALLFVYKKTIYELNNEYKKMMGSLTNEEHNIICYTDSIICMYKKILFFLINHNEFKYENKLEYISRVSNKIHIFCDTLNRNKIQNKYIECIYLFINLLTNKQVELKISIDMFFNALEEFIKQLQSKKKVLDDKNIINKIYKCECDNDHLKDRLDHIIEYITK